MKTIEVSDEAAELIASFRNDEERNEIKSYLCDVMSILSDVVNDSILEHDDAIACMNEVSNYINLINKFSYKI